MPHCLAVDSPTYDCRKKGSRLPSKSDAELALLYRVSRERRKLLSRHKDEGRLDWREKTAKGFRLGRGAKSSHEKQGGIRGKENGSLHTSEGEEMVEWSPNGMEALKWSSNGKKMVKLSSEGNERMDLSSSAVCSSGEVFPFKPQTEMKEYDVLKNFSTSSSCSSSSPSRSGERLFRDGSSGSQRKKEDIFSRKTTFTSCVYALRCAREAESLSVLTNDAHDNFDNKHDLCPKPRGRIQQVANFYFRSHFSHFW